SVGRQYQSRALTALESTKYTSGNFNYSDPQPAPGIASGGSTLNMTGGDDRVLAISHSVFDSSSNVIQSISLEAMHDDADGINIDASPRDYIQTAVYTWYDDADRPSAVANYGTN